MAGVSRSVAAYAVSAIRRRRGVVDRRPAALALLRDQRAHGAVELLDGARRSSSSCSICACASTSEPRQPHASDEVRGRVPAGHVERLLQPVGQRRTLTLPARRAKQVARHPDLRRAVEAIELRDDRRARKSVRGRPAAASAHSASKRSRVLQSGSAAHHLKRPGFASACAMKCRGRSTAPESTATPCARAKASASSVRRSQTDRSPARLRTRRSRRRHAATTAACRGWL